MICSLDMLKVGQYGKIISINSKNNMQRRHLLDMGFVRGTEVIINRIAPLGDPVSLLIRGYEICIGKGELKNINVEVLKI